MKDTIITMLGLLGMIAIFVTLIAIYGPLLDHIG